MFWALRQRMGGLSQDVQALYSAVREHGKGARSASGKPLLAQVAEMIALRRGAGRLAPDEYYQYGLYDDGRFDAEQKRAFLGRQLEYDLWKLFDSWPWHAVANDKLLAYTLFDGLHLPTPELYAIYHPVRRHGQIRVVRTAAELGGFLRQGAPYPMIVKPILGMWGKSVYAVEYLDHAKDELVLVNGARIGVDEFAAMVASGGQKGYLFQELLRPHPLIEELCGSRICSVRVVTLLDPDPEVISTLWKVAAGGAMADNFWEPGNLVGPVDAETGKVGRLFTGMGLQRRAVSDHPDTGKCLVGVTLPDWKRVIEVCLEATASLPGLKMQAWDIALTERGPVLLEVNIIGGLRLPQMVADSGLNRGALKELLRKHGYA